MVEVQDLHPRGEILACLLPDPFRAIGDDRDITAILGSLLLTRRFAINSTDRFSATPLFLAIAGRPSLIYNYVWRSPEQIRQDRKRGALVAFLLAHGANMNARYKDGGYQITPLVIARKAGAVAIMRILKEHGGKAEYVTKPSN